MFSTSPIREVPLFIVMPMFNSSFEYFETYQESIAKALGGIRSQSYELGYEAIKAAGRAGNSIFVCGNGGSASIAEHFSCDHSKGVHTDTKGLRPNVVSLASNMAAITAIGNDLGFNKIFSKQLEFSNADSDDLLVIVSSSGNSPNILNILEYASTIGMESIALIGFDGGRAKDLADIVVHVNSSNYGVVEDCHQIIMHSWAQALRIDEAVSHLKL